MTGGGPTGMTEVTEVTKVAGVTAVTAVTRVALVCLGNICRSPMAEVVLRDRLDAAGLGCVELVSAGTGSWHVGERMDERAAATLRAAGYDPDHHRARQWPVGDPAAYDLVLAMDHANLAGLGGRCERVRLFRDADPVGAGQDVPDPYYGGDEGFREVLAMVERTSDALVAAMLRGEVAGATRATGDAGDAEVATDARIAPS